MLSVNLKWYWCLAALLFLSSSTYSQSISGIVNSYYQVNSVGNNNASVEVTSATGLAVGDTVMIMQMKGAIIYDNNNAGYGDVTDYNGAGAFEYAIICDIQNNEISFNADFLNTYDETGAIQLISIPKFNTVSIDNTLTGQVWNGTTGGVIIVEAVGSITLNANIDANGIGYRGGISDSSIFDCACSIIFQISPMILRPATEP